MLVKKLKDKLRNPQTLFFRVLRALIDFLYQFSIPPVGPLKWFYRGLYYFGKISVEVWRRVLSGLLWKPMFISRCETVGKRLQLEQLPYITGVGKIQLGDDVRISGRIGIHFSDRLERPPKLTVGDNVFIGHGSTMALADRITIGNDCMLAGGTSIRDNDGHPLSPKARKTGESIREEEAKPVTIGNNVWFGSRCQVLKGVSIGDNAVIAARSLVTKDVPPNTVAAGSPAKVIRHIDER